MRAIPLSLLGAVLMALPAGAASAPISDAGLYLQAERRLHRAVVEANCVRDDSGLAAVGRLRTRLGRLRSFAARGGALARLEEEARRREGEEDICIFARQAVTFNIGDARRLIRRLEARARNSPR